MRKRTLAIFCAVLACAILLAFNVMSGRLELGAAPFLVFLVLVPLLMMPMTFLNKRLLTWRKERGRDIEEEEKYEREDAGLISISPKSQAEIEEDEKRYLHPVLR